jgi:L-methionine (R)-S-oxide reductase
MNKEETYIQLLPELSNLLSESDDPIATLANASALIKQSFPLFSWVGFYLLKKNVLVLGPFQGSPACVSIQPGRGVCGTSFIKKETIVVNDVRTFPGHIACDSRSLSEIVVPMNKDGAIIGVLDIDSHALATFDAVDCRYLEKAVTIILDHLISVSSTY